jgi:hypothetical protein
MAENYQVPQWFQDGKIGVWMHWGIPSATDENKSISIMGSNEKIEWKQATDGLMIELPKTLSEQLVIGFQILLK